MIGYSYHILQAQTACFIVYVLWGRGDGQSSLLNADIAFVSSALFNTIRFPMSQLTEAVVMLSQVRTCLYWKSGMTT